MMNKLRGALFSSKKRRFITLAAVLAVLLATAAVLIVQHYNSLKIPFRQSKFSVSYLASRDTGWDDTLNIQMDLNIKKLSDEKMIYLSRSNVPSLVDFCTDNLGNNVPVQENQVGVISVGPVDPSADTVSLTYSVKLGSSSTRTSDGTQYTDGALYDDLIAFCGKNVLLAPLMDPNELNGGRHGKYIDSVSFRFQSPDTWMGILPFGEALSEDCAFTVTNPTWGDISNMMNSSYCFGTFYKNELGDGAFYVDAGAEGSIEESSVDVLLSFYEFYANIFGEGLTTPFVILRNNPEDKTLIYGGVGGNSAAISLNPVSAEDLKAVSSTLYHAFFDSKIHSQNLRYSPNEWIYLGLADYYIDASSSSLSEDLKKQYSVGTPDTMASKYMRCLYYSLKEPELLAAAPTEDSAMGAAQQNFYWTTKVPVILDVINYLSWQRDGTYDAMVKYLVKNANTEKALDVPAMLDKIGGKGAADIIGKYFSGQALIPNYRNMTLSDYLAPQDILNELDLCEDTFYQMFILDGISYEYEPPFLLNPEAFLADVDAAGVRYNTDEIQSLVENFSPELHQLLLQYAYRAMLAGVDDITKLDMKGAIYEQTNFQKWLDYCQETGAQAIASPNASN